MVGRGPPTQHMRRRRWRRCWAPQNPQARTEAKSSRSPEVGLQMLDQCLALVKSRRALQPLSFTNIFITCLRQNAEAMGEFVLPPLAAMPLAAFTFNCGCTAYGYKIPSLVEIARSSYCVHFLGGKTKKRFAEYSTKLLQLVQNQ